MSTSLLYHAFGIVGYNYVNQKFHAGQVTFHIEQSRDRLRCSQCGTEDVWGRGWIERTFRTVPIGLKPTFVKHSHSDRRSWFIQQQLPFPKPWKNKH